MNWNLGRVQKYRECLREHDALREIANVIVAYLPSDFELTQEAAIAEIIEILEETDIFKEIAEENKLSTSS
jgi:hypothetical protein